MEEIIDTAQEIPEPGARAGSIPLEGSNAAMIRAKALLAEEMRRRRN